MDNRNINRWVHSEKSDKRKFVSVMYVISLAVVIEFLIFEILPGYIYGFMYNFVIVYSEIFESDFFYSFPPDEINYILINIMSIITALTASFITGAFLIFWLRKFAAKSDGYTRDKISWKFKLPKNTLSLIAVGLCIVQISIFLYTFFNFILNSIFGVVSDSALAEDLYFPQSALGIALYFISIVITPAFAEEFIFRYLMLNSLKKYGNAFAIIVTSVFFGFAHARTSAFIYATAIGFFTAYLAIKTKSIWFSIILHIAVNAVSFGLQYIAVMAFVEDAMLDLIYFAFLTVISAISCIYFIALLIKRKETRLNTPGNYVHIENKQKLIFFFNAASVLFFILVILKSAKEYVFL